MSPTIVDNFLPQHDFDQLLNVIGGEDFVWYYGIVVFDEDLNREQKLAQYYNFQFTHLFYNNFNQTSSFFPALNKLLEKINPKSILRIKANLSTRTPEIIEYGYHIDFSDVTTCVYYINDNDGYTKFKDGTIVNSKANRAVFFNSNLWHTGTSCTDEERRMAINLNFLPN
jgi:hypothetical protein